MAVVVTQACRPYWAYQVHDLAEGDVIPAGEFADFLLATGAPVEEQVDGPAVDSDGDGVPDGTIAQVLGWVGDDPVKAGLALEAERAGKNRATLVTGLEKLAAPAVEQPPVEQESEGTDAQGQG